MSVLKNFVSSLTEFAKEEREKGRAEALAERRAEEARVLREAEAESCRIAAETKGIAGGNQMIHFVAERLGIDLEAE